MKHHLKSMLNNIISENSYGAELALSSYLKEKLRAVSGLSESASKTVELYKNPMAKVTHESWPDGVTYRGHNVFKTVYDGPGMALIEKVISTLKSESQNEEEVLIDYQECYLGYSPSKDLFIQGYDGWVENDGEDGNSSPYVLFKINEDGKVQNLRGGIDIGGWEMWYDRTGGLKNAKAKYPDLIDIRLD